MSATASTRIEIEHVSPHLLKPAAYNPRKMTPEARKRLRNGIEAFGLVDPIIARASDQLVIGGHQRLSIAIDLKMETVPVVYIECDDQQAAALNVLLNNQNAAGEWDFAQLTDLLSTLDAEGFDATLTGFSTEELAEMMAPDEEDEGNYSRKIAAPVYEIKGEKPTPAALYDTAKRDAMLAEVMAADLPADVAAFMRSAAERHTVFDYSRIAEFYAHADAATQRLMERSALVVIDFDAAIEHGYVQMTERIASLYPSRAEAQAAKAKDEDEDA